MKSASRKPQSKRKYFKSRGFSRLFCFSWEQRKLSELYAKSSEKNDGSIGMDKNITVATMQFKEDVRVSTDEYLKTYYTFSLGDIAFEGHQSKEFRYGRFVENDIGDGIVSHIFAVFRPIREYDLHFWKYAINNEMLMQRILSRSTKASTMMHDLVTNDFLNETFFVPSLDEQKQIGAFFKQLDHLITLHQRNSIGCIFKVWAYTNAWEQRKYGEVVETRRGLTYKPSDICDSGIRVLRSSNIDEDTFVLKADDVFVKKDAVNIDYSKENDILITSANGSSRLVGKHAIISSISGNPAVHGGFMLLGTTKEPYFINASMGSSWYRRFIELYVAGGNGAIGNLNKNDLDNQAILIPSEPEQQAIGAFFKRLDHLITLHQRERKNRLFGGKNVKQYNFSRSVLQLLRAVDTRLQRRGCSQGDYG